MKIDLHTHTHYSDGHLSPEELVMRAHQMQVDVLAITDHDTTQALVEARTYQHTQKRPLQIISGIEITTRWHGFDIHILGLNFDEQHPSLAARLAEQEQTRVDRAQQMCDKLAKCGIKGVFDEAMKRVGQGQITRAHIAQVLLDRGEVSSFQGAFTRYIGKDKRAYVNAKWIDVKTAIEWIHEAGGVAAIAHPASYDMKAKWLRKLLSDFSGWGGDGMEVTHPNMQSTKKALLAKLAVEYNLKAVVGSDFHFPSRWTELGKRLDISAELTPIWSNWSQIASLNKELI
jgi:predicted metal-dependent phosphoesterase TrpH